MPNNFYSNYDDGEGCGTILLKIVGVIVVIAIVIFLLTKCSDKPSTNMQVEEDTSTITEQSQNYPTNTYIDYRMIDGDLYVDNATSIVHVRNTLYRGYDVYIPYIAPNGLPYKYINGKLEEINLKELLEEGETKNE